MDHDENGNFAEGNQVAKGKPMLTAEERAIRQEATADLIKTAHILIQQTPAVLLEMLRDPKTTYRERIVIRLLEQARVGERDMQAIKILLDRLCGPVKQKVELSGNIYDFSSMSKDQKMELLNELRKARQAGS